jgi:hypothetical protein
VPLNGRKGFRSVTLLSSPRDAQQQRTLLQSLDVVQNAAVQNQQMSSRDVHFPIGQMYTNLPLQLLNGNPPLCPVLAHSSAGLHQNQNNSEIWMFRERFGTPPGFSLPRVFLPQLLQLSF